MKIKSVKSKGASYWNERKKARHEGKNYRKWNEKRAKEGTGGESFKKIPCCLASYY